MSIKVTFEFDTTDAAIAFLEAQELPEGQKPAKRGRPTKTEAAAPAAAPAQAAPVATTAAAASAAPAQSAAAPAATASPAVPFKAVADAITELADKDLAAAKGILQKFGVAKASDLKPEQFAAVVDEAKKALSPTPAAATSLI
jgi:hypothetical protein